MRSILFVFIALVNNAGVMLLANVGDMDDATFDRQIAINLKGTFNTLREAVKRLRSGGRIINLSSSVVKLARCGHQRHQPFRARGLPRRQDARQRVR